MPTYLLHGFRWPRAAIRIHIILQDLDDCAADWIVAPASAAALTANFHTLHPNLFAHLPTLRFLEQYDPTDRATISQPHAYVADVVEEVRLDVDIDEVRGRGVPGPQWTAMMELRDRLAPGEKVGWYIVVCGDEERAAPADDGGARGSDVAGTERASDVSQGGRDAGADRGRRARLEDPMAAAEREPRGLRRIAAALRRKSRS